MTSLTSVAVTRDRGFAEAAPMNDGLVRMTLDQSLPDRFPCLRAFVSYRVHVGGKPAKTLAGLMRMSPSLLSRKLTGRGTHRLNIDDLEHYIKATGDTSPIEYLAAKFLQGDEARKARAIARVELLATELDRTLRTLKGKV